MALMVIVNTPGDGRFSYAPLKHAEWHGWTPTDGVFPSFLWIVGVALSLVLSKRVAAGVPKSALLLQAAKRAAIIFALGLFVYAYPDFDLSTQRILGVLQRIAICYFIACAIFLTTKVRGQVMWILGLLVSYWMLMTLVPVPGYGPGRLDVEGNFAHYVDKMVLGQHNYSNTKTWDPEGIVSTLPSIATALFGVLAGTLLQTRKALTEKTTWLFLAGNVLIAAGLICDAWLPINKKLWTSSFALYMAGLDCVILSSFVWIIDGLGYQKYVKPLVIMGMNAITVYMASEIVEITITSIHVSGGLDIKQWLFQHLFLPIASPYNASLLYAVSYMLSMYLIAWIMYRKNWFVRV